MGNKEKDPEHPDDPKRYIWKERAEGVEIVLYKIMDSSRLPREKNASYLEATRVTYRFNQDGNVVDRKKESKPALRAFVSTGDSLDIVVIDTDRENELGFGYPDFVGQLVKSITTGKELYLGFQPLLAQIFPEPEKDRRRMPPPAREQKFKVAVAGAPVDFWEKSNLPTGWTVLSGQYWNEKKDNYHVELLVKRKKSPGDGSPSLGRIEYVKKIYHMPGSQHQPGKGNVIEYYRPLPDFSKKDIVEAQVDYGNPGRKKIIIEREGQSTISGIVGPGKNLFSEEKPFRIDFTVGEARWRVEDRDKEGVFMYRMEISKTASDDEDEKEDPEHLGADYNH